MQVKSIAECSKVTILQYFWPSLSYHLSLRSLFCLFFEWPLKTGFTVLFSIALTSVTLTQVPAGTLSLALYTPDKQTELTSAALGATAVIKATFSRTGIIWASMGRSRGGDRGSRPPPPLKKHKDIGFPSNIDPDPLKITKLPSHHSMAGQYRYASKTPFQWHFAGGPMIAHF